jgi:septum formation protein
MIRDYKSYTILLASQSPRRRQLLEELRLPFRVVETGHSEEIYPPELEGGEIASYLAQLKSRDYPGKLGKNEILLTADTVVWHLEKELGKPANRDEAIYMLSALSGSVHQVYTGVCLRSLEKEHQFYACTDVQFAPLSGDEITYYVDHFKPFDKAGAYGIQEWIGHIGVESMEGSYFNVMGLPVQKLYTILKSEFLNT